MVIAHREISVLPALVRIGSGRLGASKKKAGLACRLRFMIELIGFAG
jgi:hypothetical protein